MDIEPQKITPTWCNKMVGDDRVAKNLDIFLLEEVFLDSFELVRQWVVFGGEYDHLPIMLDLRDRSRRVSIPFKFFEG